jgi:hypothetical protein
MTEQPLGRARRIRAQPRRHIDRQHQPPALEARQRQTGQHPAQPAGVDGTAVQAVVQRAMSTAVFGQQRQINRRLHRPVRTQHRVGELEQLIAPGGQTRVELAPEA